MLKMLLIPLALLLFSINTYADCQNKNTLISRGFNKLEIDNYLKECQKNPRSILKLQKDLKNMSKGNFSFFELRSFLSMVKTYTLSIDSFKKDKVIEALKRYKLISTNINYKENNVVINRTPYGNYIYNQIVNGLNVIKVFIQSSSNSSNVKSSLNGLSGNDIAYFISFSRVELPNGYDGHDIEKEKKLVKNRLRKLSRGKNYTKYERTNLGKEVYKQLRKNLRNKLLLK